MKSLCKFCCQQCSLQRGRDFDRFWILCLLEGRCSFFGQQCDVCRGRRDAYRRSSKVKLRGETTFKFNKCSSKGGAVLSRVLDSSTSISSGTHESSLAINGPTVFANNQYGSNGGGLAIMSGLLLSFETNSTTFIGNEAEVVSENTCPSQLPTRVLLSLTQYFILTILMSALVCSSPEVNH